MTRENAMKTGSASRWALFVLLAVFFGASAVLLRFEFWGSFRLILPVQSPVNAESIIALDFLLIVFLRVRSQRDYGKVARTAPHIVFIACTAIVAFVPFSITIGAPLVHDSYTHVGEAATETWRQVRAFFTHPSGGDLFYRPLGYLSYWLDFRWAGYDPFRWHLWSVIFHVVNTCLVYALATQLAFSRFAAVVAALVFALHGSRAEAVSWVAARFDLLACFFVLLSLLSLNKWVQTRRPRWYAAMIFGALLAVLSKESAYCLPLLALGMIPFKPRSLTRDLLRCSAVLFAVSSAAFSYRFWVLKGVGGYRADGGESALLHFSLIRTIKPLFFRQWALLFFPINWSTSLPAWLKAGVVIMLIAMCGFIVWSKASKQLLLSALSLVFLADIPVHHLLLMTADLAGSRVLYLPVLGLSFFWALLAQGCERARIQLPLSAALLLFQLAALTHNLLTWRQVAFLAQRTCRSIAAETASDDRAITIHGLPNTWHGVFFLGNGFPECVQMNAQHAPTHIYMEPEQPSSGQARAFIWNDQKQRLEEANSPNTKRSYK